MTYSKTILLTLIGGVGLSLSCAASAQSFGLGVTGGTDGIGVNGKAKISDTLQLTVGYTALSYEGEEEYDGVNYTGDLNISNAFGLISLHPFSNGFNVAGGVYIGDRSVDMTAISTGPVEIGTQVFTPAEIGSLTGTAETNSTAPYAGIGFDNFLSSKSQWTFSARLGVIFSGEPDVSLVSTGGTLSDTALFQAQIDTEIARLEEDIEDFKYYPVVALGLTRRF